MIIARYLSIRNGLLKDEGLISARLLLLLLLKGLGRGSASVKAGLHEFKQVGVGVGLELVEDECVAYDVLPDPVLLLAHQPVDLGPVLNQLLLLLLEVTDIVAEQVVGDDEGLVALRTLLASIADAIRVVVVLARRSDQDSHLLQ